jgi:hypothetical protein
MKVSIKDLQVKEMDLGNNGIELDVYDNQNKHLGDLRIGRGTVEWCKGRTRKGNGTELSWKQLIDLFEAHQSKPSGRSSTKKKMVRVDPAAALPGDSPVTPT